MNFTKKTTISLFFLTTSLFAQVSGYIMQIDEFLSKNLNSSDKNNLVELRETANSLAILINECNSISINHVPNPECNTFYKTKLPKFESDFAKVTNGIYLNSLKITNSLKTKTEQINSCVESVKYFYSPTFYPENMIVVSTNKFDINPLNDENITIDYDISVQFDEIRSSIFHKNLKKWYKICLPIVSNGYKFNDYFINQLKHEISDEYRVTTTMDEFRVIPKNREYSYIVNDVLLFKTTLYKLMVNYELPNYEYYWITLKANSIVLKRELGIKEVFIRTANKDIHNGKRTIQLGINGIEGGLQHD